MKKVLTLIAFVLTLVILAGCNPKSDVKIAIRNVTAARTTIYMEFDVTDPKEIIADNGIVVVLYYLGNEITRKSPTYTSEVTSIIFEGLSVGYKYTFNVFATYSGKAHKMASGEATTTTEGGSATEPKLVSTIQDFLNIPNDLTAFYRLENDLDFENADFQNPFGSKQFAGNFDGNGKTIKNMNMVLTTTYIGLFGYNRGTIKNLTVENVVLNYQTSTQNIGIIAGKNAGTIENVTLKDSSITAGFSRTGQIYIGGITGLSETSSKLTNITIDNVDILLTITGRTEPYVGLLTGRAQATQVTNASASGSIVVSSMDVTNVGGLIGKIENVGLSGSSVTDSNSNVDIEVDVNVTTTTTSDFTSATPQGVYVGGLLGYVIGAEINSVYAKGKILITRVSNTSTNNRSDDELLVGGLVGFATSSIINAYTDVDITVGSATEVTIISIERVSIGGIVGVQLGGERLDKAVYLGSSIVIYPGNTGTLQASKVVGNMNPTNSATLSNVSLSVGGELIDGRVVNVYGDTPSSTPSAVEVVTYASLQTYFTSTYILQTLIFNE